MKEKIRKVILCVCVLVFLYSAFQLGKIIYDYYKIDGDTNNLINNYVEAQNDENDEKEEKEDPLKRVVDFESLLELNGDVIGWIYVPDTKIDEPILKGENNDSYLKTDIYGNYSNAGTLFIDEINDENFTDQNTIIYGHNMKNGSRFHYVKYFLEKDFFEEHPYIYIYLPDGSIHVYQVYVSRILDAYSELYQKNIDYQTYTQTFMKGARQTREISDEEALLIMLSTCVAYDDQRFVVSARLDKIVKHDE